MSRAGQRPNSLEKKPVLGSPSWPWQRSLARTPRITLSTCWPQPAQVVLLHLRQVTGRHMPGTPRVGIDVSGVYTLGGIYVETGAATEPGDGIFWNLRAAARIASMPTTS